MKDGQDMEEADGQITADTAVSDDMHTKPDDAAEVLAAVVEVRCLVC